jgi:hypothetical protein
MVKDLEGLSERCGEKPVLEAAFATGAERRGIRSESLALSRRERGRGREVRTMSSVGGRRRSSLGVSDGTGVGILKIEEADDGALSIRMMRI